MRTNRSTTSVGASRRMAAYRLATTTLIGRRWIKKHARLVERQRRTTR